MNCRHAERHESARRRFACGESRPFRAVRGFAGSNPGLSLRSALGFRISPPWGFPSESGGLVWRTKLPARWRVFRSFSSPQAEGEGTHVSRRTCQKTPGERNRRQVAAASRVIRKPLAPSLPSYSDLRPKLPEHRSIAACRICCLKSGLGLVQNGEREYTVLLVPPRADIAIGRVSGGLMEARAWRFSVNGAIVSHCKTAIDPGRPPDPSESPNETR
jgi:hypothetical protein